jgi:hypothetical protein
MKSVASGDPDAFVDTLLRDGFCTGLRLPEAAAQRILEFAENAYCYGDAKPAYGFRYRDKLLAQEKSRKVFSQGTYLFPMRSSPRSTPWPMIRCSCSLRPST